MPIDIHPKHQPPTPEQIIADQKRQAETARRQKLAASVAPASAPLPQTPAATSLPTVTPSATVPAAPDSRDLAERVVDSILQSAVSGELAKFDGKNGKFVNAESEQEIDPNTDYVVHADDTHWGFIKFHDDGTPPDRHQGPLYGGFVPPARADLGDLDESQWPLGLSGQTEDPWKLQFYLVLQATTTQKLLTFVTSSETGRRGVSKLLAHYNRMRRQDPNSYPVVRMVPSGYTSKKYGWVHTPSFRVVGRLPKDSAGAPSTPLPDTSPAGDMNDSIPF